MYWNYCNCTNSETGGVDLLVSLETRWRLGTLSLFVLFHCVGHGPGFVERCVRSKTWEYDTLMMFRPNGQRYLER